MRYRVPLAALAVLLTISLTASAQRHSAGPRFSTGARVGVRPHFGVGVRSHGGVGFRGGVSFGHNPRFGVFVNSRPRYYRPHYSYRRYAYPYVTYPYFSYPYPLAYYGAYDFLGYETYTAPQTVYVPYPVYTNSADVGLDTQMRQQQVGMYAEPQPAQGMPATNYPTRAPGIDSSRPYPQRAPATAVPEPDRPATLLVYRDGRTSEIRNYAVVGQTLWIFSEERAEKVALSLLDLDATRKANEERGLDFPVSTNR